ncbi:MAG TPA: acetate--CoA ligase family protein [Acidobacteriota bacterium]|nr:acetate--CoA ligase family protein [Acidobacteriota bacterium]
MSIGPIASSSTHEVSLRAPDMPSDSPDSSGQPPPDLIAARRILLRARLGGATSLLETEGKALLDALGIATPPRVILTDPAAASELPERPFDADRVVLKALAPGVLHKTEAGAVRVLPASRDAVMEEIAAMARRLDGISVEGYLLEKYVPHEATIGREFLLGMRWTPDFGPVVTLGAGGIHAEFLAHALRDEGSLAVFSPALTWEGSVEATIARLAPARLAVEGQRGGAAALDPAHLADVVRRFLALAAVFCPKVVAEFEVNPLVVSEGRLVALDAVAVLPAPGEAVSTPAAARPLDKIERLLRPGTIALVGVSETSVNPGRIILRNLLRSGFDPALVRVVKPGVESVDGVGCVASLSALGAIDAPGWRDGRADLVVLAVSASASAGLIEEIVRDRRAESVILIPGGLDENPESAALVARMHATLERSRAEEWRGPVVNGGNCLGIRSVPGRYNTLFIPEHKLPAPERPADPIAFLAGSGAFAVSKSSKLTRVNPLYTITVGNQMDLTVADYLEFLQHDPLVEIFAVYLEGFRPRDGVRFLKTAAEIARSGKPVILYRGGRTEAGHAAASSHTAAIAGDAAVARALARDAGVVEAETLEEFEDLVRLFVELRGCTVGGLGLGAVSNAGYETVAIADNLGPFHLPRFADETNAALRELTDRAGLKGIVTVRNPLDLTPILADPGYEEAVRAVLADPAVSVGVVGCVPLSGALQTLPRGEAHQEDVEREGGIVARLVRLMRESPKAWVAVVDAGPLYDPMARALEEGGVPTFRAADRALRVFGRYCEARIGLDGWRLVSESNRTAPHARAARRV